MSGQNERHRVSTVDAVGTDLDGVRRVTVTTWCARSQTWHKWRVPQSEAPRPGDDLSVNVAWGYDA